MAVGVGRVQGVIGNFIRVMTGSSAQPAPKPFKSEKALAFLNSVTQHTRGLSLGQVIGLDTPILSHRFTNRPKALAAATVFSPFGTRSFSTTTPIATPDGKTVVNLLQGIRTFESEWTRSRESSPRSLDEAHSLIAQLIATLEGRPLSSEDTARIASSFPPCSDNEEVQSIYKGAAKALSKCKIPVPYFFAVQCPDSPNLAVKALFNSIGSLKSHPDGLGKRSYSTSSLSPDESIRSALDLANHLENAVGGTENQTAQAWIIRNILETLRKEVATLPPDQQHSPVPPQTIKKEYSELASLLLKTGYPVPDFAKKPEPAKSKEAERELTPAERAFDNDTFVQVVS
jgi:hypothetical protein